ncbi:MAG: hypothetical protein H0W36_06550 [Gemmatimonadetes bacterium]|nr:hypothetical protein [Gemmatimonadota bacterium]
MRTHMTSAAVLTCTLLGLAGVSGVPHARAQSAPPKAVTVTGGGPVIQVLPGPAQFADSAAPIIAKMPAEKQQMMQMMASNGPFSDRVAKVSGTFGGTFWDAGARGDSVAAKASFRSQDGAKWEVTLDRVAPEDESPMEPHWGGVATEIAYHGATGVHAPLVPTVRSVMSYWGMAKVTRNGTLVTDQGPAHVMLTSDTRGDDFAYQCWICTGQPVRQLHLMLMPPEGKMYEVPGGILHVMWENSRHRIANPGS